MSDTDADITAILADLHLDNDGTAVRRLLPLVYHELRGLSEAYLRRERPDHTLQATALVHEAYVRLADGEARAWENRAHFFRAAAKTMRHILMKHARAHGALKRGGDRRAVALDDTALPWHDRPVELLDVDAALVRLEALDPVKARVVELKFYGGCTNDEAAEALGFSASTVERHWRFARAWLHGELDH